jgi:hypothetical protein
MRPEPLPVACTLPAADRLGDRRRLEPALVDRGATADGVRAVYATHKGVEAALRELVRAEAERCGFARWEVEHVGDVVLDVRAEGEGRAALRAICGESGAS